MIVPRLVARKFADFTNWLTQNLGVTAGSEQKPVFSSSGVANCRYLVYDSSVRTYVYSGESRSVVLTRVSASDYSDYIYDFELGSPVYSYADFVSAPSVGITFDGKSSAMIAYDKNNGGTTRVSFYRGTLNLFSNNYYNGGVSLRYLTDDKYKVIYLASLSDGLAFLQYGVHAVDGVEKEYVRVLAPSDSRIRFTPDDDLESRLSVFAPSYYKNPTIDLPAEGEEAANPTLSGVGDGTATTIEDLLQQILAQLQANTLAPTLDVAGTETGGNTGTDEDAKPYLPYIPQIFEKIKELPGTLANIWETVKDIPAAIAEKIGAFFTTLWGWLQSIIDAIKALPAAIAEKIKALFVPHEGYAAEFVADITATYQGRMGLLTYPFTVLADFVGTVATLEEQEPVLRWDAVEWQNKTIIAAGEYNLKSAVSSAQMQTVYMIYKTVVSGMLVVAFLHLCYKKLKEVQRN